MAVLRQQITGLGLKLNIKPVIVWSMRQDMQLKLQTLIYYSLHCFNIVLLLLELTAANISSPNSCKQGHSVSFFGFIRLSRKWRTV